MEETKKQMILYLRDVLGLSFYQIEDGRESHENVPPGFIEDPVVRGREEKGNLSGPYRSLMGEWFKEYPTLKAEQAPNC